MPEFWEPKHRRHMTICDRVWAELANERFNERFNENHWTQCQDACANEVWNAICLRVGSKLVDRLLDEAVNV